MTSQNSKGLSDLTAFAEQMGVSASPRLKMFKQMLEMQRQASASEDEENRTRRKRVLEQRALAFLQERNREFAAACGACPCFGESRRCKNCAGVGRPGWKAPDEGLFLEYIGPVLRNLGILGPDQDKNQVTSNTTPADHSGDVNFQEVNNE
jgi:hypothetical protein